MEKDQEQNELIIWIDIRNLPEDIGEGYSGISQDSVKGREDVRSMTRRDPVYQE